MIDLRSDTVTRPGAAMRQAIADADVGDDVLGDDPTAQQLEKRVADLLGKEAALLFPSGIMANLTAMQIVAERGTEVIIEATGHILDWELGGAATIAGVLLRRVPTEDGILRVDDVAQNIRPGLKNQLTTSAIAVENTHNGAGGKVLRLDEMQRIFALARSRNLRVHLDGSRLWNASAATGVPEAAYAACADTVMVTLSKGLGCPIGSMLAGSSEDMSKARLIRRRLGGAMRQSGILAAAGLYALDHNRTRLTEDHANATLFAQLASEIEGVRVVTPETNIVMVDLLKEGMGALDVVKAMRERGVLIAEFTPARVRAVTHLDVDAAGIRKAVAVLSEVIG